MPAGRHMRDIEESRAAGDVAGLLVHFETLKKPQERRAIVEALRAQGDDGRNTLMQMLGDTTRQRPAAAALVELGEDNLPPVQALVSSEDPEHRRGALLALYMFARYRGTPAACDSLREISADSSELADSARSMLEKAESAAAARNAEIDRLLAQFVRAQAHEDKYSANTLLRLYASKRGDQMDALQKLIGMRYAGVAHLIEVAPEVGDPAIAALLALGLHQIGGDVVPPVAAALRDGDKKMKTVMLRTLLCLRRASVPGAAEALEASGITPTETANRKAAAVYRQWVRER